MKGVAWYVFFGFVYLSSQIAYCEEMQIDPRGYWIGKEAFHYHIYDRELGLGLVDFFNDEKAQLIVDFGCGLGDYVKTLKNAGFNVIGYDGNPDTFALSGGVASVMDLSAPFDLGERFDWVVSLEVGEHLPAQYETIFVENLIRHCKKGILLSWAVKNQGGCGHFNEQNNDYIKEKMAQYGFINDLEAERKLREVSSLPWFKDTIMVFRKASTFIE